MKNMHFFLDFLNFFLNFSSPRIFFLPIAVLQTCMKNELEKTDTDFLKTICLTEFFSSGLWFEVPKEASFRPNCRKEFHPRRFLHH